ncbi:5'-3' exonuclease H3TH domain-containing protein, partial [Desulfurella sp.]|uniref:5'-3' exonuclease n=1 Tax=Desulfurella sp. TaxID=1962857 RepID=UPI0025B93532
MKEKVYLIDGSSFLYRFFYAIKNLSYNNFPTSVIFGFARLLLSLKDAKYILICFDSKEKTFRKELFDEYKKQRPPIPDDLAIQIEPTKEIIKAFGVKYLELAGFEADDIIATLANKFKKDFDVVIVTQDKDLFQLVDDNVFIFDPVKNITYDYQKTIEKFGVKPQQISDLLALAGDSSDGIPGVENIGPKTAVKLLTSYGDIDSIIKNKDRLPQKIKENIDEEKLKLYKSLTILDKNINFDNITIDSIKKSEPDLELLTKLFKQYNFKSLMDKLVPNKNNNKNCNQANLFDEQLPSYQTDDSVLLELAAYL